MTTLPVIETHSDELTELLRRVARRADCLHAAGNGGWHSDRRLWLRAEFEVFEQYERERLAALRECGRRTALV
jgi:hypothetical protein